MPDDADWAQKTPDEILSDINHFFNSTINPNPPNSLVARPDIYIAFIRATVTDPYQRLKILIIPLTKEASFQ